MRRFIASARHRAHEWLSRSSLHRVVSTELADGLRAYAYSQAFIIIKQAVIASRLWKLPDDVLSWIPHDVEQLVRDSSRSDSASGARETAEELDEPDEDHGVLGFIDDADISDAD